MGKKGKKLKESEIRAIGDFLEGYSGLNYAFIFGSAIRGMHANSDVDIMLKGNLKLRDDIFFELSVAFPYKFDLVFFDFRKVSLMMAAFSKGKLLFARDKDEVKEDYFRIFRAYDDAYGLRLKRIERIKRKYCYGK